MKVKVYKADGTFYEVDDPGVIVPVEPIKDEPTTEDLVNILLGVTDDE
jgi:hypothetical protein